MRVTMPGDEAAALLANDPYLTLTDDGREAVLYLDEKELSQLHKLGRLGASCLNSVEHIEVVVDLRYSTSGSLTRHDAHARNSG